jgi:hypothetical protein
LSTVFLSVLNVNKVDLPIIFAHMERLRKEKPINLSGRLQNESSIPILKARNYKVVTSVTLDGDAPKQFIRAYFFEEDSPVRKEKPSTWPAYIAKTAEKWYPHESVIEYMINRVGQVLDLNMNGIRLVWANHQIRFLSRYFLKKDEKLIHGAEICGEYLNDIPLAEEIAEDKKSARELFTFEFIRDAIRTVFPDNFEELLCSLVKMIVFDGLTGNNDRHFYNWGVIDTTKKSNEMPIFAPLYDSARGLFWNADDASLKSLLQNYELHVKQAGLRRGNKVVNYIANASPRISIESNKKANHFELIDFIKRYRTEYRQIADDLASPQREKDVLKMLRHEFYPLFTRERQELLSIVVKRRFEIIRNL